MSDLKPCPFCGGKAFFERLGTSRQSTIISCDWCGTTHESNETFNHGHFWNTRHIDPLTKAQIEADVLRRVADEFGIKSATDDNKVYCCALLAEADRILKEAEDKRWAFEEQGP